MNTWEKVMIAVCFFLVADMGYHTYAVHTFKNSPAQVKFTNIQNYINTLEHNASIEEVSVASFLKEVSSEDTVYFTLGENGVTAIVSIRGEKVSIVKKLPSAGTVSSVESKLIDKNISYEWLLENKKPESFTAKLVNSKLIPFLFLAGMAYLLLVTSGINLFQKEFDTFYPDMIEGSLDDLIGYDDIKQESRQLLEIITQNSSYAEYGIDGTFNILFSGKAGTGKSKFALLLAKELGVPIVAATGSLDEIYVGSGAKKIRTLFKNAQNAAAKSEHGSAIVFIDEAQKMLRKRGAKNDEKWSDDTANELLAYLDGVQSSPKYNIIVIMASNFDENSFEMDEAMLRRFRKKVCFRAPNFDERKKILTYYLADITQKALIIDVDKVAKNMSGMTPAIIESIVNEAALMALRAQKKVDTQLLMKAVERVLIGASNKETTQNKEKIREIIAVHEMGHFLIGWHRDMHRYCDDYQKVREASSIVKISSESVSQIGVLGFVMQESSDEMMLQSIEELEWEVKGLYGGLAAERVVFGQSGSTTGSAKDIEKATRLLKHLVVENSVYEEAKLDYTALGMHRGSLLKRVEKKSASFYAESCVIIETHKELLTFLAQKLVEEWSLDKERLFELIGYYRERKQKAEEAAEHGFCFYDEDL